MSSQTLRWLDHNGNTEPKVSSIPKCSSEPVREPAANSCSNMDECKTHCLRFIRIQRINSSPALQVSERLPGFLKLDLDLVSVFIAIDLQTGFLKVGFDTRVSMSRLRMRLLVSIVASEEKTKGVVVRAANQDQPILACDALPNCIPARLLEWFITKTKWQQWQRGALLLAGTQLSAFLLPLIVIFLLFTQFKARLRCSDIGRFPVACQVQRGTRRLTSVFRLAFHQSERVGSG